MYGLFDSLRRLISRETKENPAYQAIISLAMKGPQWTPANYTALSEQGYVNNTDAFSCVNVLSNAAKGVPWKAYEKSKHSEPTELDTDHPLSMLIDRPNPRQGRGAFIDNLVAYYQLTGNTYIARVGPDNKPPKELWTLRPDRMRVVVGTSFNPIERYDYFAGSALVKLEPDNLGQTCLHIKTFHPLNDWYGLSPLQAASRSIDQSNAWQSWNVALGQNMARPSGALVSDGPLSDEQFERLTDEITRQYSGFRNAGRPLLLENGLKWQAMGLTPIDADWLNGDDRATRKICAAFGVPPELIGILSKGGMNDSNFKQARKRLYLETILPLLDIIKDEFNNWLTPLFGDNLYVDYVRDEIEAIQEDRKIIFDRAVQVFQGGIAKLNEARRMVGLPPDNQYGDVYFVSGKGQLVGPDSQNHAEDMAATNALVNPQPEPQESGPNPKPAAKPKPAKKSVEIDEHALLTAARELADLLP